MQTKRFSVLGWAFAGPTLALALAAAQGKPPGQADPAKPATPPDARKILEGTDRDDTLNATTGDDWLFGKKGNDFLTGGPGRDTIDGGEGDDTIDGGPDADVIDAGAGNDTVRGAEGNDTVEGNDNDDVLDGGAGNDDLDGGDDNDTLRGGPGDDLLSGGDGADLLDGGAGADRLNGNDGADTLKGVQGDDLLAGGDDADVIHGGAGNDELDGGQGDDTLFGELGNDSLLGSCGDDTLDGGAGHDVLIGGLGRDVLKGSSGDDWILGGRGADALLAGDGNDLLVLRAGDVGAAETESINGEEGADILVLNGFAAAEVPIIAAPPQPATGPPVAPPEYRLSDPLTGGTYRFVSVERIVHTHVFPGVDGDRRQPSTLTLVNPSTSIAAEGQVTFFGSDTGAQPPAKPGGAPASASVSFKVAPLGSVTIATPPAAAGSPARSAQVIANVPLAATVQAGFPAIGSLRTGEAALVDSVVVPVLEDRATGAGTGVVVFNSSMRGTVTLTLHAPSGRELSGLDNADGVQIDMPADGHRLLFVRDVFPRLGDFQGTLTIAGEIERPQEGGPMAVTGIQQRAVGGAPASAAFPVRTYASAGVQPRDTTLHFPRLTSGGGQADSLVLINTSILRARGTLAFRDESGASWPVALNGQNATTTTPFDLARNGSVVLTTSSAGPLRAGSVRVTLTEGVVGGVVRVAGGPAQIGPGGVFERFVVPVTRNRAAGTTSQVAVSSTGPAVSLRFVLREAGGTELPGGAADVQLPAGGSATRTLEQLFPGAAMDNFQGTLMVTASGGPVAAAVTEVGGGPMRTSALPVVPLR